MKNKTAAEWLAIPEDKLPEKLGEALTLEPWEHCGTNVVPGICNRCGNKYSPSTSCTAPDPIDIKDWNVAMKWRDKAVAGKDSTVFANYLLEVFGGGTEGDIDECFAKAQPRDYLRAAALAAEKDLRNDNSLCEASN